LPAPTGELRSGRVRWLRTERCPLVERLNKIDLRFPVPDFGSAFYGYWANQASPACYLAVRTSSSFAIHSSFFIHIVADDFRCQAIWRLWSKKRIKLSGWLAF